MVTSADLLLQKCRPQQDALVATGIADYLAAVPGWRLNEERIVRDFAFKNYYQTIAFVNALAGIIHAEDHHPELLVTYNRCIVGFNTHSVNGGRGGLSQNDFICAAKVNQIFEAMHPNP